MILPMLLGVFIHLSVYFYRLRISSLAPGSKTVRKHTDAQNFHTKNYIGIGGKTPYVKISINIMFLFFSWTITDILLFSHKISNIINNYKLTNQIICCKK